MEEAETVQEFPFDGVYARAAPQREENVRRVVNRQPKRRGLFACFSQPLVNEPVATCPSRAMPSRLRLTVRHLEYSSGARAVCLPLADIRDVQSKWILTGGVRVSKVAISLVNCVEPVVVRGLKNPEDLVDALKRQHENVTEKEIRLLPREQNGGPACAVVDASPADRASDVAVSPSKRMTPRALFADATSSPASVATSACGSMTMLSAFARCPAQDFSGAECVAQELRRASPRRKRSNSYSSSGTSETPVSTSVSSDDAHPPIRIHEPGPRPKPGANVPGVVVQPVCAPRQPSNSVTLSETLSMAHIVQAQPHTPRDQASENGQLVQEPPVGERPSLASLETAGARNIMSAQWTPDEHPCPALQMVGGSPPPRIESCTPVSTAGKGSLHPPSQDYTGGIPPPVPEDSGWYVDLSTHLSVCSSKSAGEHYVPPSQRSSAVSSLVGLSEDSSLPPLPVVWAAERDTDAVTRLMPAEACVSMASSPVGRHSPPSPREEGIMASQEAACVSSKPLASGELLAGGSDRSSSSVIPPRLVPDLLTKSQRQGEGCHERLSQSCLVPASAAVTTSVLRPVEAALAGANGPSDGGRTSFQTARLGEMGAETITESPQFSSQAAATVPYCVSNDVDTPISQKSFTPPIGSLDGCVTRVQVAQGPVPPSADSGASAEQSEDRASARCSPGFKGGNQVAGAIAPSALASEPVGYQHAPATAMAMQRSTTPGRVDPADDATPCNGDRGPGANLTWTATSGGSKNTATSGASTSQRTLAECDSYASEQAPLLREAASPRRGGARSGEQTTPPVMLFPNDPGGMPPVLGRGPGSPAGTCRLQQDQADRNSAHASAPTGGASLAAYLVYGAELSSPPVEQTFLRDSAAIGHVHNDATASTSGPVGSTTQQHLLEEMTSYSPPLLPESPVAAVPRESTSFVPGAVRGRRVQQLTESPVGVLYRLQASASGALPGSSQLASELILASPSATVMATMARQPQVCWTESGVQVELIGSSGKVDWERNNDSGTIRRSDIPVAAALKPPSPVESSDRGGGRTSHIAGHASISLLQPGAQDWSRTSSRGAPQIRDLQLVATPSPNGASCGQWGGFSSTASPPRGATGTALQGTSCLASATEHSYSLCSQLSALAERGAGHDGVIPVVAEEANRLLGEGANGSSQEAARLDGCALGMHQMRLLARNCSESRTDSRSEFASPGSVPLSGSVGSRRYTRMVSVASSSDACGADGSSPRAGVASQYRAQSVNTTLLSSDDAEGAHVASANASQSSNGGGLDCQVMAQHTYLLAPNTSLSVEALTLWPESSADHAAPGGASSPRGNKNAPSDATDDDILWLFGPVGASAPDSPRMPLPPRMVSSVAASPGGCSRRGTADTTGSSERVGGHGAAITCSWRSSSGSWREHEGAALLPVFRGSPTPSPTRQRTLQSNSTCKGNQRPVTPSSEAVGLAARPAGAAHAPMLLAGIIRGSSRSGAPCSSSRSSSGGREKCESSCSPASVALNMLQAFDTPMSTAVGRSSGTCACNPMPQWASGDAGSDGTPVSPDLSEISSAAYCGEPYEQGRLRGHQAFYDRNAEFSVRTVSSTSTAGEDLFQNPLYSVRGGKGSPEKQPLSGLTYGSSGGGGSSRSVMLNQLLLHTGRPHMRTDRSGHSTSTHTFSRKPLSLSQMSLGGEDASSTGRRRTREEVTYSSCAWNYGSSGGSGARLPGGAGECGVDAKEAWRVAVADALSRRASTKTGHASSLQPAVAGTRSGGWGVPPAEHSAGADGSDGGSALARTQLSKRARTTQTQPEVLINMQVRAAQSSQQQQQQQLGQQQQVGTSEVFQGGGTGTPLASPLMVLNPAYVRSTASPGDWSTVASPTEATSDDIAAARADAVQRSLTTTATAAGAVITVLKLDSELPAEGVHNDDGIAVALQDFSRKGRQCAPQLLDTRFRDLAQLQEAEWGSMQGSPSSQQAAHAAVLLRHANDAVDFAREAVQRGDAQWLSRVTATLQAVQSALDALRDF